MVSCNNCKYKHEMFDNICEIIERTKIKISYPYGNRFISPLESIIQEKYKQHNKKYNEYTTIHCDVLNFDGNCGLYKQMNKWDIIKKFI